MHIFISGNNMIQYSLNIAIKEHASLKDQIYIYYYACM